MNLPEVADEPALVVLGVTLSAFVEGERLPALRSVWLRDCEAIGLSGEDIDTAVFIGESVPPDDCGASKGSPPLVAEAVVATPVSVPTGHLMVDVMRLDESVPVTRTHASVLSTVVWTGTRNVCTPGAA